MLRRSLIRTLVVLAGLAFTNGAFAQMAVDAALVKALKEGGYVIVIRHGATFADQADTDPLNPANVAKQRQLNDKGRAAAETMGKSFKTLGIPGGKVYTSQFQRAVDTGKLIGVGDVTPLVDITEGGLVVSPIENNRRADAFRKLVGVEPAKGTNTYIVSHKPNIIDAFGKDWFEIKEGEATVFRPDGMGGLKVIARVQMDQWTELAKAK